MVCVRRVFGSEKFGRLVSAEDVVDIVDGNVVVVTPSGLDFVS